MIRVGSNVNAWCTKCKLVLAHTIEAAVGTAIKRVACNTCGGKHQYKAAAPGTTSVTSPRVPRIPSAKGSIASSPKGYDTVMAGKDLSAALPYEFRTLYTLGALIRHPDFGYGVVVADKGSKKIDVLFSAGAKTLVHGR